MIKEFKTGLEIKKERDFLKKIKRVNKYAEEYKDKIMMDYLEALEDSYYINQNDREKLNQYLDKTIPVLDGLIAKYKNLIEDENNTDDIELE